MPNNNIYSPKENIAKVEEVRYLECQYHSECIKHEDGTLTVRYKTEWGTNFSIDGDQKKVLEASGSLDYVLHCLRDKLRKLENGQIKVINFSSKERDWEQEEKIKKQLWEDINVNKIPHGLAPPWRSICLDREQVCVSNPRPPSPKGPCDIS